MAVALVAIIGLGWAATPHATPLPRPKVSVADNKRPLSQAELATAAAWARRLRSCAATRNLILGEPEIHRNEVVIPGRRLSPHSKTVLDCAVKLGDPPPSMTFALFASDRQLHLYKPRACLLPAVDEPPA